jgi:hypothetical protein
MYVEMTSDGTFALVWTQDMSSKSPMLNSSNAEHVERCLWYVPYRLTGSEVEEGFEDLGSWLTREMDLG